MKSGQGIMGVGFSVAEEEKSIEELFREIVMKYSGAMYAQLYSACMDEQRARALLKLALGRAYEEMRARPVVDVNALWLEVLVEEYGRFTGFSSGADGGNSIALYSGTPYGGPADYSYIMDADVIIKRMLTQYGDAVYRCLLTIYKTEGLARAHLKELFKRAYGELRAQRSIDITELWLKLVVNTVLAEDDVLSIPSAAASPPAPPYAPAPPFGAPGGSFMGTGMPPPAFTAAPQASAWGAYGANVTSAFFAGAQASPFSPMPPAPAFAPVNQANAASAYMGNVAPPPAVSMPAPPPAFAGPPEAAQAAAVPFAAAPHAGTAMAPCEAAPEAQNRPLPFWRRFAKKTGDKKGKGRMVELQSLGGFRLGVLAFLSLFILFLIWCIAGLLMDIQVFPKINFGYDWFNKHVFELF